MIVLEEAILKIEEMVRHFIMSYRLYTLREKHSDTKIIDIAILMVAHLRFQNFINSKTIKITL